MKDNLKRTHLQKTIITGSLFPRDMLKGETHPLKDDTIRASVPKTACMLQGTAGATAAFRFNKE